MSKMKSWKDKHNLQESSMHGPEDQEGVKSCSEGT